MPKRQERGLIERCCSDIQKGYLELLHKKQAAKSRGKSKPPIPRWETPLGYLKLEVYVFALHCQDHGLGRHIEKLADRGAYGPKRKAGGFADDPFHWTICAIEATKRPAGHFSGEKLVMKLSDASRSRIASELQLARRCAVPVTFLLGFLWQAGGAKACANWHGPESSPMLQRLDGLQAKYQARPSD